MKVSYDEQTIPLPLIGGVIQEQRLVVPPEAVMSIRSYRHACRLAWKLRAVRNLQRRTLAEACGLYASHVSDYFSLNESKRELPARHIAAVERVLGNTVISQWVAQQSKLTVLEEMQAQRNGLQRQTLRAEAA